MVDRYESYIFFKNTCPNRLLRLGTRNREVVIRDNCGFTLIELIVISAILGVLVLMALPAYKSYLNSTKIVAAASDIRTIEKAISAYLLDKNMTVPAATLGEMGIESPLDPWKRTYVYQIVAGAPLEDIAGQPLNTDYDLYSMGQDGASDPASGNAANADDIARSNDGGFVGVRP